MSESIVISGNNREERYRSLIPQLKALLSGESDAVANMGNICAVLKETFGFLWVGFYLVKGNELVLGPFQGPVACTRIQLGKGVCGTSWQNRETLIVPDVDKFPGHITCSTLSKSEIVIPIIRTDRVVGVLDIDSIHLNDFTELDRTYLQSVVDLIVL